MGEAAREAGRGGGPDAGGVACRTELVGRLVRDHGENAFRFAYRLTGNADESRDLVQEAYRRVLARHDQYDPAQPLGHWFFRILRHLFLDAAKRYDRRNAVSLDEPLAVDEEGPRYYADVLPDGEQEVLRELERAESGRVVRRALSRLPVEQRAVLTLCDVQGLSYEEIGRVMDCPLGTVRSRISRAREGLKTRLLEGEETFA